MLNRFFINRLYDGLTITSVKSNEMFANLSAIKKIAREQFCAYFEKHISGASDFSLKEFFASGNKGFIPSNYQSDNLKAAREIFKLLQDCEDKLVARCNRWFDISRIESELISSVLSLRDQLKRAIRAADDHKDSSNIVSQFAVALSISPRRSEFALVLEKIKVEVDVLYAQLENAHATIKCRG